MNQLKTTYNSTIREQLVKDLAIKNPNQIPRVSKVVVSAGVGRAIQDSKHLEQVVETLASITGQKPVVTKARKSIATFKLREGNAVGATVTLRGDRMYYFLERLIRVVLPRLRDFRGLSTDSFDPQGNYSIGIREHTVFPEISYEKAGTLHGLQINIVTTAKNREDAEALLRGLGLPLRRNE